MIQVEITVTDRSDGSYSKVIEVDNGDEADIGFNVGMALTRLQGHMRHGGFLGQMALAIGWWWDTVWQHEDEEKSKSDPLYAALRDLGDAADKVVALMQKSK